MAKHQTSREKRRARIRRKISGTPERPRLTVYKSLKHMYAALVDDTSGKTLLSVGTTSKVLKSEVKDDDKTAAAKKVGAALAQAAKAKGIEAVVFEYVHFYGNYNVVQNNEIYKITNEVKTPYGCQMLNISGNNNVIRGNTLSRMGSNVRCLGVLLEWDLADANLIEGNTIMDSGWDGTGSLTIAGGDNNVIRHNTVYAPAPGWYYIYNKRDGFKGWPCNEESADESDIPAKDPAAEDYSYYYPHNCRSVGNAIYDNTYIHAATDP